MPSSSLSFMLTRRFQFGDPNDELDVSSGSLPEGGLPEGFEDLDSARDALLKSPEELLRCVMRRLDEWLTALSRLTYWRGQGRCCARALFSFLALACRVASVGRGARFGPV